MDGLPEASPPMSAPLLLWVILLHWATSGGFVRGGRTWQHCTGRSKARWVGCAGREASRQVLAVPGNTLGPVCSHGRDAVWGSLSLAAQAHGFSARVPVD